MGVTRLKHIPGDRTKLTPPRALLRKALLLMNLLMKGCVFWYLKSSVFPALSTETGFSEKENNFSK